MIIDKILKKIAKNITWSLRMRPNLHTLFFKDNKVMATDQFKRIIVKYKKEVFEDKNICATDIINNAIDIEKLDNKKVEMPEIEKFFLQDINKNLKVKIDVDFMIKVLEIYKTAKIENVILSFDNTLSPIDFYWEDEKIEIKALLMPLKIINN